MPYHRFFEVDKMDMSGVLVPRAPDTHECRMKTYRTPDTHAELNHYRTDYRHAELYNCLTDCPRQLGGRLRLHPWACLSEQ